jgi:hypothetical protein
MAAQYTTASTFDRGPSLGSPFRNACAAWSTACWPKIDEAYCVLSYCSSKHQAFHSLVLRWIT